MRNCVKLELILLLLSRDCTTADYTAAATNSSFNCSAYTAHRPRAEYIGYPNLYSSIYVYLCISMYLQV